jgi:hypothetical protein
LLETLLPSVLQSITKYGNIINNIHQSYLSMFFNLVFFLIIFIAIYLNAYIVLSMRLSVYFLSPSMYEWMQIPESCGVPPSLVNILPNPPAIVRVSGQSFNSMHLDEYSLQTAQHHLKCQFGGTVNYSNIDNIYLDRVGIMLPNSVMEGH